MTSMLTVNNVSVAYAEARVVDGVSFELASGDIGCFLGPSGCGKSTLLRAIAGFEPLRDGNILLNDKVVSDVGMRLAPEKRNIGMVFQDYSLFPHLNIADNVAFGIRHLARSERQQRTRQLLKLVSLEAYASRYPHELSGGQQQRIALIRALAPKPNLLLMDEPFSSMDIELRKEVAIEVRDILKHENITAILVTHDQNEAFIVADHIGVMEVGKFQQWSDGYDLYHQPQTPFVADFIGQGVFIDGVVVSQTKIKTALATVETKVPDGCHEGSKVKVFVRPDDISLDETSALKATIIGHEFRGANYLYTLEFTDGIRLLTLEHSYQRHNPGDEVGVSLDMEHVVVFSRDQL